MSSRDVSPDAPAGNICVHCREHQVVIGLVLCPACAGRRIRQLEVEKELAEKRATASESQLADLQRALEIGKERL